MENGADPEIRDNNGNNAFDYAQDSELCKILGVYYKSSIADRGLSSISV